MPTRAAETEELDTIEVTVQAGEPDDELEQLLNQDLD